MKVTQIELAWGKDEHYYYCTEIQDVLNIDEDLKYRLMDEAQNSYLNSASGSLNKGRVTSRECFVFDSYQEASKAREKYLISEQ